MTIHVHCLVFEREGALLLVRKRGTQRFLFPGGKPEPGEAGPQTIIRECREELRVELDPGALVFLGEHTAWAANEAGERVVAQAWRTDQEINPCVASEIEELCWWPVERGEDPCIADLTNDYLRSPWEPAEAE